jgi:alkanesulfonate monooxygenase SsuD/methylene tetrahydromethanopterin reductase-like flavin-dependent oxidoreductase (luciferase family)
LTPGLLDVQIGVGWGYAESEPADASARRLADFASTVERLGFDSLWLSDGDHHRGVSAVSLLAATAACTKRLSLYASVPPAGPVWDRIAAVRAIAGGRVGGVVTHASADGIDALREAVGAPAIELWIGDVPTPTRAAAAERAGRDPGAISLGTTLFVTPDEREIDAAAAHVIDRRPGLARRDHVAVGLDALSGLIDTFVQGGATQLVLVPVARHPEGWCEALAGHLGEARSAG